MNLDTKKCLNFEDFKSICLSVNLFYLFIYFKFILKLKTFNYILSIMSLLSPFSIYQKIGLISQRNNLSLNANRFSFISTYYRNKRIPYLIGD
jgi:hypothetical protein